jgi:transposase-like protein
MISDLRGIRMSKSKHSEAQIIAALKQVEAGRTADDVAREHGVSKHTLYAWKATFGGMEASEAQKLRADGVYSQVGDRRFSSGARTNCNPTRQIIY